MASLACILSALQQVTSVLIEQLPSSFFLFLLTTDGINQFTLYEILLEIKCSKAHLTSIQPTTCIALDNRSLLPLIMDSPVSCPCPTHTQVPIAMSTFLFL